MTWDNFGSCYHKPEFNAFRVFKCLSSINIGGEIPRMRFKLYSKCGNLRWGNACINNTYPILLIVPYGFYFCVGEIFAKREIF